MTVYSLQDENQRRVNGGDLARDGKGGKSQRLRETMEDWMANPTRDSGKRQRRKEKEKKGTTSILRTYRAIL